MKKTLQAIFALTILGVSFAAQAKFGGVKETPIKDATLYCNYGTKGMYAFNVNENRFWLSSPGQTTGIELSDVKIDRLRCPNCYDVSGVFVKEVLVEMKVRQQGLNSPVKANVTLTSKEETETFQDLTCSKDNR